jgi:dihydroorotase
MKRMGISLATVFLIAFVLSGVYAQEAVYPSVLLKGGHVIDPANNISKIMDVLVRDGKIVSVDSNISESEAEKVVDVSKYYVTPGLIDIHVHCFHTSREHQLSIIADHHHFPSGVTTVVDAGTSGARSFEDFKKVIDSSRVRILAFLNIAAQGMGPAEMDPSQFNVKLAAETAKKYPDIIVGFKTAHYFGLNIEIPFDDFRTPWASVDSVIAAGRMADLPVMLDCHPKPPSGDYSARSFQDIILKKMRPGDIYTHCFARQFPLVLADEKVNPDVIKARKRGIIFDVGHGGAAFTFKVAVPAIEQGFLPNSISTDLHRGNVNGPVYNMVNVMSKFLCMGMLLEDVIRCSTANPVHYINRPELGNLSVGSTADIAVLEMLTGDFSYSDVGMGKIEGDKKLRNVLTLFGGEIVYDLSGISYPLWENIPANDDYWSRPVQDW